MIFCIFILDGIREGESSYAVGSLTTNSNSGIKMVNYDSLTGT